MKNAIWSFKTIQQHISKLEALSKPFNLKIASTSKLKCVRCVCAMRVFDMCVRCVCVCLICVWDVCVRCVYDMGDLCVQCVCKMLVFDMCLICVCRRCVWNVCVKCVCEMCVWGVCWMCARCVQDMFRKYECKWSYVLIFIISCIQNHLMIRHKIKPKNKGSPCLFLKYMVFNIAFKWHKFQNWYVFVWKNCLTEANFSAILLPPAIFDWKFGGLSDSPRPSVHPCVGLSGMHGPDSMRRIFFNFLH